MTNRPLPPAIRAVIDEVLDAAGLGFTDGRDEIERELVAHFEDGLGRGLDADTLIERFGNPREAGMRIARTRPRAQARQRGESRGWWMSMGTWMRELTRAGRRLRRAPGFAWVVVLTLALGVGVNTAIFSVLNGVLLEDLPYAEPDRLVRVYEYREEWGGQLDYIRGPIVTQLRDWDEVLDEMSAMYTYRETGADLTDGPAPVRVNVLSVSAGYFETLGRAPLVGRTFIPSESYDAGEAEPDREPAVAVLSHRLWRSHYDQDPEIVGRTVELDGSLLQVVGVMTEDFRDPIGPQADVWTPQDLRSGGSNSYNNFYLTGIARLRDGVTVEAANDRLAVLGDALLESVPEARSGRTMVVPLQADLVGDTRRTMLWILAAAAALVLLTACLNVANLLFTRGLGQDRALALKAALGSGRARLVAGLLAESAILAMLGGALGLGLGWLGTRALLGIAPDALPTVSEVTFGLPVFGYAFAITVGALVAFGLAPAIRLSRTAPAEVLRSGDRSATAGRVARRLRDGLVTVQVAAALVLMAGAGLLTRSFDNLLDVALGMDPVGVVTFEVHLPTARYPDPEDRVRFHEEFQARIGGTPGVVEIGAVSWLPVNGRYHSWGFEWDPEGTGGSEEEPFFGTDVRIFQGDYFESMGIRLVRGDPPSAVDLEEPVVWVNEEVVRSVMSEYDPLAQTIQLAGAERRIAGVVADVPWSARGEVGRVSYVPHRQADNRNWALIQTVRSDRNAEAVLSAARTELRAMDPNLVLFRPETFTSVLSGVRAQDRFATTLMAAFGLLAVVLALVGTYGVLSGSVSSRTREIGIRVALGADRRTVRSLVLRYAAALTIPGIALGLAIAVLASRWVETLLFGISSNDPWTYVGASVVFLAVAALAGWLPARRATRVDTVEVLTAE